MSVTNWTAVTTCSRQFLWLCAAGILFVSCASSIAEENEALRHEETAIHQLFSSPNGDKTNTSKPSESPLPEKYSSLVPKPLEDSVISNKSINVNNSSASNVTNSPVQESVSPVKSETTSKDISTTLPPALDPLTDPVPAEHHQPSKARKGVSVPPDSEVKPIINIDDSKNKSCCTDVIAEGSQEKNCQACNETRAAVHLSNVSTEASNISPSSTITVVNATLGLNSTNSSIVTNEPVVTSEKAIMNQTSVNSTSKSTTVISKETHKSHKPLTLDDSDEAEQLATSSYPEGGYIVPIVATIFAAPLLIVLVMLLYKRGREFWERRHYRRMDFLIEGMYND